jgi:hypothetical protein
MSGFTKHTLRTTLLSACASFAMIAYFVSIANSQDVESPKPLRR